MAKVHTLYCGLLVRGSHVEKYKMIGVTSWFMPGGLETYAINKTAH